MNDQVVDKNYSSFTVDNLHVRSCDSTETMTGQWQCVAFVI